MRGPLARLVPHLPRSALERVDRWLVRPVLDAPVPVARRLAATLRHLNSTPGGVSITPAVFGGVPGEIVTPDGVRESPGILYAHGGAYVIASPATHRSITATLALEAGLAVFAADYRLAPEHPAPAARDDALAAYRDLAGPGNGGVALAGDSAGGGIALACAQAAIASGLPAPAGLALISPWVDLTLSGESYETNRDRDALLTINALRAGVRAYASRLAPDDPVCSPLFGELSGLPPVLIQAGAKELLRSDAELLAERARAAGCEVELEIGAELWHDYQVHAGMMREADEALAHMGAWLAARLRSS